jgi:hypothetical protein
VQYREGQKNDTEEAQVSISPRSKVPAFSTGFFLMPFKKINKCFNATGNRVGIYSNTQISDLTQKRRKPFATLIPKDD